jgi:hypothetical protein
LVSAGIIAVNMLAIEFIGFAMVALCVIVLATPSGRRETRRPTDL